MTTLPGKPFIGGAAAPAPSKTARGFVLAPPYVHGRASADPPREDLPSINDFLDDAPPIEKFAPSYDYAASAPEVAEQSQATERASSEWSWGGEADRHGESSWGGGAGSSELAIPEPAASDWDTYDWNSAGRLGGAPADAAAEAWASTDWSEPEGKTEARQSAAEALARALDQIARRIRAGELTLPGPETARDDAAVAAALAALLGVRR